MPKRKMSGAKRSMTFSGCFTCRSRGVKCDEHRPACRRCVKAGRVCDGYGVRLIWEEDRIDRASLRSQRRHLPRAYDTSAAELDDENLDAAIDTLDALCLDLNGQHHQVGPFTIFQAVSLPTSATKDVSTLPFPSLPLSAEGARLNKQNRSRLNMLDMQDAFSHLEADTGASDSRVLPGDPDTIPARDSGTSSTSTAMSRRLYGDTSQESLNQLGILNDRSVRRCRGMTIEMELATLIKPFPPPPLDDEARLLHYWMTDMSHVMIATPKRDNPFRSVLVPLALSSRAGHLHGTLALRHGIYAMAAFSWAQQHDVALGTYQRLGLKHQQFCLEYLQQSLAESSHSQPEATLGAIIMLILLDLITGDSFAWRTHIRGGRKWLQCLEYGLWKKQGNASTLYQIFLLLEALGGSVNALDAVESDNFPGYSYDSIFGMSETALHNEYRLEGLYGLTRPILEAIIHINMLGSRRTLASSQEIENLRVKILLNDPRALCLDGIEDGTERNLVRHHAYVFHHACRIHFERTVHNIAPQAVQDLVRHALEHLQAIASLEININVAGLMWPVFVTACEAESEPLRKQFEWYFGKGQKHGILGISAAHYVLCEVWKRRDARSGPEKAQVRWQQVMADLGLDILLT